MNKPLEVPKVQPGGLVTVAYLKAQVDEGTDHLGIFMPLLLDTVIQIGGKSFTAADIHEAISRRHKLAIPEQSVTTLLGRATRQKLLRRESGRYFPTHSLSRARDIAVEKARIEAGQDRLAAALRDHAVRRGLTVSSNERALQMLFRFLEEEQVSLLLNSGTTIPGKELPTRHEKAVIAEFVYDAIRDDPAFRSILNDILEGLVLYRAAFLPDLDNRARKFKNLKVLFDSVLVRQAIGYEGTAMRALLRETIDVLRASDAHCVVLDKTVHEIRRILVTYEQHMATDEGRRSLRPVPMARHFLTERYSPSDIRELSALLENDIEAVGLRVEAMPHRKADFTAAEKALAVRFADPITRDEQEPRVVHDVDCVAAVLQFRGSHRGTSIEDAGAVFATSSPMVIRNARAWWREDEREESIEPIVHIRGLANLAWLKRPHLSGELKERELISLCTAAMRPSQATWQRFLRHLEQLKRSNRISSNEVTAILVSALSDRLLREVEEDDPDDIDAASLDEVVERVKESYGAQADAKVREVVNGYEEKIAAIDAASRAELERASAMARSATERLRERELATERRARKIARLVTKGSGWIISGFVIAGAIALIFGHAFHLNWLGILAAVAVVLFVLLEMIGILGHVHDWSAALEVRLTRQVRGWLAGGDGNTNDVQAEET